MAIRGPQPKAQARNRNPLIHEWTEVERIPFEGGPDLLPRWDDACFRACEVHEESSRTGHWQPGRDAGWAAWH